MAQLESSWRWSTVALRTVAATVVTAVLVGVAPVSAMESQADFVFDMLGPVVCEFPPAEFDLAEYRRFIADNPDLPLSTGSIEGGLSSGLVGASGYGDDGRGSYMVGVQGILLDAPDELTVLCLVLAHIGKKDAGSVAGAVVGEAGIDSAADGDFLGVFKLVRRGDGDGSTTYATGTVTGGTLRLDEADSDVVAGTLSLEGYYTPVGSEDNNPLTVTVDIPYAENILEPVWTLERK